MPIHKGPAYQPPLRFLGAHIETLYPYLFRQIEDLLFERQRIDLPDGDFLDLDWSRSNQRRLLVLCHGLEGSSQSQYMKGMTIAANSRGMDVVAINFRSCSGEMNRQLRLYHHGDIEDLTYLLQTVLQDHHYHSISLCGFSLGGNVILKYLGTARGQVPPNIRSAAVVSVPCDLASSSEALDQWYNQLYTRRFMKSLKPKFIYKSKQFPGKIDMSKFDRIKTWREFDNTFTAQVTGFANADEYYLQGSAKYFIEGIRIHTLILNASNDPFLQQQSYPFATCEKHRYVYLQIPRYGGHVGFWFPSYEESYAESRVMEFIQQFG